MEALGGLQGCLYCDYVIINFKFVADVIKVINVGNLEGTATFDKPMCESTVR
jgi:hypothetical protein